MKERLRTVQYASCRAADISVDVLAAKSYQDAAVMSRNEELSPPSDLQVGDLRLQRHMGPTLDPRFRALGS